MIARTDFISRLRSSRRWSARGIRPSGSFSCLRAVLSTHVLVSCGSRQRVSASSFTWGPGGSGPVPAVGPGSALRGAVRLGDRTGAGGVAGGGLDGPRRGGVLRRAGAAVRGARAVVLHRLGLALEDAGRLAEGPGHVGQLLGAEEHDDHEKDEDDLDGLEIAEHKRSTFSPGAACPCDCWWPGPDTCPNTVRWLRSDRK